MYVLIIKSKLLGPQTPPLKKTLTIPPEPATFFEAVEKTALPSLAPILTSDKRG